MSRTTEEPVPAPEPPSYLSAGSAAIWRSLNARYEFEAEELGTLRAGLEALDRASTARRRIREDGLIQTTSRGTPCPHPGVQIANASTAVWIKALASLGLDVADAEDGTPSQSRRGRGGRFVGRG